MWSTTSADWSFMEAAMTPARYPTVGMWVEWTIPWKRKPIAAQEGFEDEQERMAQEASAPPVDPSTSPGEPQP
jgi:hypothetical protein